ncbi:MAG TPA: hypothetical protein VK593_06490, partial [Edaphobacter sp.]|nr:hypothetical protein [Edaphobacter sp.]
MKKALHPDVERLLNTVLRPNPNAGPLTVEGIRAATLATGELLGGAGEAVAKVWNSTAQTGRGTLDLRWYAPSETPPDSLILFVHGGGWISGTLDSY